MKVISNTLIIRVCAPAFTTVYAKLWDKRKANLERMGKWPDKATRKTALKSINACFTCKFNYVNYLRILRILSIMRSCSAARTSSAWALAASKSLC